jgi:hypothetical protein
VRRKSAGQHEIPAFKVALARLDIQDSLILMTHGSLAEAQRRLHSALDDLDRAQRALLEDNGHRRRE